MQIIQLDAATLLRGPFNDDAGTAGAMGLVGWWAVVRNGNTAHRLFSVHRDRAKAVAAMPELEAAFPA